MQKKLKSLREVCNTLPEKINNYLHRAIKTSDKQIDIFNIYQKASKKILQEIETKKMGKLLS